MLIPEYQDLGSLGQEADTGIIVPAKKKNGDDVELTEPGKNEVILLETEEGEPVVYLPRYEEEAPSGATISITAEEEAQAIRDAITQNLVAKMTRYSKIEDALIGAVGNAIGFAIGGFLVGLILKEKARV